MLHSSTHVHWIPLAPVVSAQHLQVCALNYIFTRTFKLHPISIILGGQSNFEKMYSIVIQFTF